MSDAEDEEFGEEEAEEELKSKSSDVDQENEEDDPAIEQVSHPLGSDLRATNSWSQMFWGKFFLKRTRSRSRSR